MSIIKPGKSEVVLIRLNKYSCVYIVTQTQRLLTNPSEIDVSSVESLDYVLITDEQPESFDENVIMELHCLKKVGKIIADETSYRILRSQIPKEMLIPAAPNKLLVSEGLVIKSYPSENREASTPVTYMITLENGCKLFQTGQSLISKTLSKITKEERPDITFLPVGFNPKASIASFLESVSNTESKLIIPCHGENVKGIQRVVKKKGLKTELAILEVGKPFVYKLS
ncbi:MAG: MBL fold metallo-hydrolase [Thermoproteota archaeon]